MSGPCREPSRRFPQGDRSLTKSSVTLPSSESFGILVNVIAVGNDVRHVQLNKTRRGTEEETRVESGSSQCVPRWTRLCFDKEALSCLWKLFQLCYSPRRRYRSVCIQSFTRRAGMTDPTQLQFTAVFNIEYLYSSRPYQSAAV